MKHLLLSLIFVFGLTPLIQGQNSNIPCTPNSPVFCGDVLNFQLNTYHTNSYPECGNGNTLISSEKVFVFSPDQTTNVTFRLTAAIYHALIVYGTCDGILYQCLGYQTASAGQTAELNLDLDPGTYYVVADGDQLTSPPDGPESAAVISYTLEAVCQNCVCTEVIDSPIGDVVLCESFDTYSIGNLTPQSALWNLWAPGTSDDASVVAYTNGPGNFLQLNNTGTFDPDVLYNLGNRTSGRYRLSWDMWIFSGETGYYNIQHTNSGNSNPNWAYQVDFGVNGSGSIRVGTTPSTSPNASFSYTDNEWTNVMQIIDLDNDYAELWINHSFVYSWQFSLGTVGGNPANLNQLGAINFYATEINNVDNNYAIDRICLWSVGCEGVFCTQEYDPVCVNGVEYSNTCYARCAGYISSEWIHGNCCEQVNINNLECEDFYYYYSGENSGELEFTFVATTGNTGTWWVNNQQFNSQNPIEFNFETPGTYDVCYVYIDQFGCEYWCCKTICIDYPVGCNEIGVSYNSESNLFQLDHMGANSSNHDWFDIQGNQVGEDTQTIFISPEGECGYVTYCVTYYDWEGCFQTCCITFWLCDPYECDDILYDYNGEGYDLSINNPNATNIQWYDDITGQQVGGGQTLFVPLSGNCHQVYYSVKYYDPTCLCWKICCISFWLCDPYNCGQVTYDYNGNNGYDLALLDAGNVTSIQWFNDETGQQVGTGPTYTVPITGGCHQVYYSVKFYDYSCNCWRVCCISFWLCDPYACGDIFYNYNGNNGYELSLNAGGANQITWYNDATGQQVGSGQSITVPISGGCHQVYYSVRYYDPFCDCWKICCISFWLCDPYDCDNIFYDYNGNNGYSLSLDNPNATDVQWYNDETGQQVGSGQSYTVAIIGGCHQVYYSVRYYDPFCDCWKICCISFWLCDPYECDNILYDYNGNNGYNLSLDNGSATDIQWFNDETGQQVGSGSSYTVPINGGCHQVYYSVRYYDPFCQCWKICCISFWLCDPYQCDNIFYNYNGDNAYDLSLNNDSATNIQWYNDDTGQQVGTGQSISIPITGGCHQVYYSVRYYDPFCQCWKVCCISFWLCDPYECDNILYDYNGAGGFNLTLDNGNATDIQWFNDSNGAQVGTGQSLVVPIGVNCQQVFYSVRYYDPFCQCWKICCISFWLCTPYNCDLISYEYNGTNGFNLDLGVPNATNATWFDDDSNAQIGTGGSIFVPIEPECRYINVSVKYWDPFCQCWRICCLNFWLCAPDCDDLGFSYSENNGYNLYVDNQFASNITWYNDDTGAVLGTGQNVFVPVTGPCDVLNVRAYYYDSSCSCWRTCYLTFWLCNPYDCDNITYGYNGNNGYNLSLNIPNASQVEWFNDATGESVGFGNSYVVPIGPDCYQAYYSVKYYDPICQCWKICCITFWVCDPYDCDYIVYGYNGNNGYNLTLNLPNATNIEWYNDTTGETVGFGSSYTVPFGAECYQAYYSVRFYDPVCQCWRVCCISFWLCDPYDCDNIIYGYNGAGGYNLSLNLPNATQIEWINDLTGQVVGFGDNYTVPFGPECYQAYYSVRYYDSFCQCWRICCISFWLCDPYDCDNIIYGYNGENGYDLSLNIPNATNIEWINDLTGQVVGFGDSYTVPVGIDCYQAYYSVRYYDPLCQCWRVCCISFWLCNPYDCGQIIYNWNEFNYGFNLSIDAPGAQNITWYDDTTGEQIGAGSTNLFISTPDYCDYVYVSIRYYDPFCGCWRICCLKFWNCPPVACCSDDPLSVDWITDYIANCDDEPCEMEIYCCYYQGQPVYNIASDPTVCSDPWGTVYDCNGNELFFWGGIAGLNLDLYNQLTNCILIYKCGETDCCVDDPITAFPWILETAVDLGYQECCNNGGELTIERCMYNGECVYHYPPKDFNCITDDVGSVYDCHGNLLFIYGGFGGINLDLYEQLTDCEEIWNCNDGFYPPIKIEITEVCGAPGEVVEVPVIVSNFDAVSTFQFSIHSSNGFVGQIIGYSDLTLPFQSFDFLQVNPTTVNCIWLNDNEVTLPDNSVIFNIRVQILGINGQSTTLTIEDQPIIGGIVASNNSFEDLPVNPCPGAVCVEATVSISGNITLHSNGGVGIALTEVELAGVPNDNYSTDNTGYYEFNDLMIGNNYTVTPLKDINHGNGINVIDIIRIRAYLLGTSPFTNPYQYIAADVNKSNSINVIDLNIIRQLILGNIQKFPNNTSWRFVGPNYSFINPNNPLAENFPELGVYNPLNGDLTNENYDAVKTGDVNDSADPANLVIIDERSGDPLNFIIEDQLVYKGASVSVPVKASDFNAITGMQLTLAFDRDHLTFNNLSSSTLEGFGEHNYRVVPEEGLITLVWTNPAGPVSIEDEEVLLKLNFTSDVNSAALSDLISIIDNPTMALAANENQDQLNIGFIFEQNEIFTDKLQLRSYPNPFSNQANISCTLPTADQVIIRIFDIDGKEIKTINTYFEAGENKVRLSDKDLQTDGIYFIRVQTSTETGTLRVIKQ